MPEWTSDNQRASKVGGDNHANCNARSYECSFELASVALTLGGTGLFVAGQALFKWAVLGVLPW